MTAIELLQVGKTYRTGATHRSLREAVPALLRRAMRRDEKDPDPVLWALRDVSFTVDRGETFGVVGPNGAGKTTLLKLLSSVTYPTEGRIRVDGRLSSLIELGSGFHLELSGRENIYLYGSILGIRRRRMAANFDRIVAFSGLERFIDTPLKRYSSGMFVRLGFAVAIHVEPDVLLVDEVLAVGDMAFQRRCLDKLEEIRSRGATVVVVSHNLRMIESLCRRAAWLEGGRVRLLDDARSVVAGYASAVNCAVRDGDAEPQETTERRGSGEVRFTAVRVVGAGGEEPELFRLGDRLVVEMEYRARQRVDDPSFDVAVYAANGVRVCTATTRLSAVSLGSLDGTGMTRCVFESIPLTAGGYTVTVAIFDRDDMTLYDQWHGAAAFSVASQTIGDTRWQLRQDEHGVVYLPVTWERR
jgi:homopolymeric O-antigen transport system ATP-binding protein